MLKTIKPYISVVTPIYGCAKNVSILYERLEKSLSKINTNFEIMPA